MLSLNAVNYLGRYLELGFESQWVSDRYSLLQHQLSLSYSNQNFFVKLSFAYSFINNPSLLLELVNIKYFKNNYQVKLKW